MSLDTITLEEAMGLFSFPKNLGAYEEKEVLVAQGRFGPYIKFDEKYVSIPRGEDPHAVTLDRAVELIEEKRRADAPIGEYNGEPYTRGAGRFGPYLKWKNLYISIPKSINPDEITPEQANNLIAAKVEKENNRYIHNWEEEKISVENGRYGAYIKFGKKNFYLRRGGEKITDTEIIKNLTLDDVKNIILEQDANAFGKPKKSAKKAEKSSKKTSKKTTTRKKKISDEEM